MRKPRKRPVTGYVIHRGPSRFDGAPLVVIAVVKKSKNAKTGRMVQTYILRSDLDPRDAIKTGADYSICASCIHRGLSGTGKDRSCYVNIGQGPLIVWRTFQRGRYPDIAGDPQAIATIARGREVRLGTYGDPAGVPNGVWKALLGDAIGWTGYTHQWRTTPDLKGLCMASVDSPAERDVAQGDGFRTFRVMAKGEAPDAGEVLCPASKEAGQRTQCADCLLCPATARKAKSIAIPAHSALAVHFEANREAA